MAGLKSITNEVALGEVLAEGTHVLFKHSSRCFLSTRALGQVERFLAENPTVSVYMIDVIGERTLSTRIADRLDVRHESPQAILIKDGFAVWHASHLAVTAKALRHETDRTPGPS